MVSSPAPTLSCTRNWDGSYACTSVSPSAPPQTPTLLTWSNIRSLFFVFFVLLTFFNLVCKAACTKNGAQGRTSRRTWRSKSKHKHRRRCESYFDDEEESYFDHKRAVKREPRILRTREIAKPVRRRTGTMPTLRQMDAVILLPSLPPISSGDAYRCVEEDPKEAPNHHRARTFETLVLNTESHSIDRPPHPMPSELPVTELAPPTTETRQCECSVNEGASKKDPIVLRKGDLTGIAENDQGETPNNRCGIAEDRVSSVVVSYDRRERFPIPPQCPRLTIQEPRQVDKPIESITRKCNLEALMRRVRVTLDAGATTTFLEPSRMPTELMIVLKVCRNGSVLRSPPWMNFLPCLDADPETSHQTLGHLLTKPGFEGSPPSLNVEMVQTRVWDPGGDDFEELTALDIVNKIDSG